MSLKKENIFHKILFFFLGKPPKVKHTFFGNVIDAGSYFECRRLFEPTNSIVEIGLEKTKNGKDTKQINFFKWIEANFDLIIEEIQPFLTTKILEWIPDFEIKNFKSEFKLDYLFIPSCERDVFGWKIMFYADNELQHACEIEMFGMEVRKIDIE